MAEVHKKYGGSAIARTMLCPGSPAAIQALPERPTNDAAARGTRIHSWFERYLKGDYSVKAQSEQDKLEATIAAKAGEKTKELIASFGLTLDQFKQEDLMVFHPEYPNAGGSPDLYGYQNFRDLVMVDLKAGHNQVFANDNHQLAFYACMVLNNIDPFARHTLNNCHMVIVQPNEDGSDVQVRVWSVPVADLAAYEALYKGAIDRAEAEPDLRVPGTHCKDKYCDARTTCPAYLNYVAVNSNEETAKIFAAAAAGTDRAAKLKILLDSDKLITDLLDQAKQDAKDLLSIDPDAITGWYLKTDVKGDREWEDWKKAEKALKDLGLKIDEIAPRKPLTPPKVEKLFKDKKIDADKLPAVSRPDAKPQLKKGEKPEVFAPFAPEPSSAPAGPSALRTVEASTLAPTPTSGGDESPKVRAAMAGA